MSIERQNALPDLRAKSIFRYEYQNFGLFFALAKFAIVTAAENE
jgi:hypothetical protein